MNTKLIITLSTLGVIIIALTIHTIIGIKRHGIRPPEKYGCRRRKFF